MRDASKQVLVCTNTGSLLFPTSNHSIGFSIMERSSVHILLSFFNNAYKCKLFIKCYFHGHTGFRSTQNKQQQENISHQNNRVSKISERCMCLSNEIQDQDTRCSTGNLANLFPFSRRAVKKPAVAKGIPMIVSPTNNEKKGCGLVWSQQGTTHTYGSVVTAWVWSLFFCRRWQLGPMLATNTSKIHS